MYTKVPEGTLGLDGKKNGRGTAGENDQRCRRTWLNAGFCDYLTVEVRQGQTCRKCRLSVGLRKNVRKAAVLNFGKMERVIAAICDTVVQSTMAGVLFIFCSMGRCFVRVKKSMNISRLRADSTVKDEHNANDEPSAHRGDMLCEASAAHGAK